MCDVVHLGLQVLAGWSWVLECAGAPRARVPSRDKARALGGAKHGDAQQAAAGVSCPPPRARLESLVEPSVLLPKLDVHTVRTPCVLNPSAAVPRFCRLPSSRVRASACIACPRERSTDTCPHVTLE